MIGTAPYPTETPQASLHGPYAPHSEFYAIMGAGIALGSTPALWEAASEAALAYSRRFGSHVGGGADPIPFALALLCEAQADMADVDAMEAVASLPLVEVIEMHTARVLSGGEVETVIGYPLGTSLYDAMTAGVAHAMSAAPQRLDRLAVRRLEDGAQDATAMVSHGMSNYVLRFGIASDTAPAPRMSALPRLDALTVAAFARFLDAFYATTPDGALLTPAPLPSDA